MNNIDITMDITVCNIYDVTLQLLISIILLNRYNHLNFIHRCNIPVVIMGETGCGKTRLIRYMCDLAARGCKDGGDHVKNMLIMKVQKYYNEIAGKYYVQSYFLQHRNLISSGRFMVVQLRVM